MDDRRLEGEDDLERALEQYVEGLSESSPEDRARLSDMARSLQARRFPEAFIFASLRSSAAILSDADEESSVDEAMKRQEVRRFIEANPASVDGASVIDMRKDVKNTERE